MGLLRETPHIVIFPKSPYMEKPSTSMAKDPRKKPRARRRRDAREVGEQLCGGTAAAGEGAPRQ